MTTVFNCARQSLNTLFSWFFPDQSQTDVMKEPLRFGAPEWKAHFGIDVDEPEVPTTIQDLLENNCPFWSDKRIKESHFLCLIPKDLTLKKLYELTQCKLNSSLLTKITDFTSEAQETHWILITRKIIPTTSKQSFDEVEKSISALGYQIPTMLEAATAVLTAKFSNLVLFPNQYEFTLCQEVYNNSHVLIGHDYISPCSIYINSWGDLGGAAGVRH